MDVVRNMRPQVQGGNSRFRGGEGEHGEHAHGSLIGGFFNVKVVANVLVITGRRHADGPGVGDVSEHRAQEHNRLNTVGEREVHHVAANDRHRREGSCPTRT